ncbi:MAG: AsmA family protein [Pseudomonadota bacterium]|nr:AsmA family protein [Pseudomonadota bacterium]
MSPVDETLPANPPADAPPPGDPDPTARRRSRAALDAATSHPWLTILVALAIAAIVLVLLWDWNWFKGPIERQVEARTGRELEIGGNLDVDLGWVPTISAEAVRFGNAAWSKQPTMAAVDRLEFRLELRPLFAGQVRIPELRLTKPRLSLETGPEGGGNWDFGQDDGDNAMQFRRVWIDEGNLRFLNAAGQTDIEIAVASQDPERAGDASPIALEGGGQWQGNKFTIEGRAESPLALQDGNQPYRIDVRAVAGATRAHARGSLVDPLRLRDFDLQLALSGRDMGDLYPLIGVATPPTPPYALDGRFTRGIEGNRTTWHYDDFSGTVGDSDLAGNASVATGGKRPFLRANLSSKQLDFDDLAGFVGGAPQSGPGETGNAQLTAQAARRKASGRVLPDTAYELERLRAMDADVRWKARRINAPGWPIDDMDAHLKLENGVLRLDPLNFGIADGDIRSTIAMDARKDTISTRADINARGLTLSKLLPKLELAQNAVGKVGGTMVLAGNGNSIAKMLASSNGDVSIGMGRGQISNLLMEYAGIDLAEIIKFKLTGDRLIPVRCAFGDFVVKDGVMTARSLAFDTTDTILIGSGTISLRDERLDLLIRPRPKDRSLLSLRAPLSVDGTFKDPAIRPDLARVGLRGAIALALGTITPPAALLATLELGPGEDSSCGGRYAK